MNTAVKETRELEECSFSPDIQPLRPGVLAPKAKARGVEEAVFRLQKGDFDRQLKNIVRENMGRSADEVMRSLGKYDRLINMLGLAEQGDGEEAGAESADNDRPYKFESEYLPRSSPAAPPKPLVPLGETMTSRQSKRDTLKHLNEKFARFQKQYEPIQVEEIDMGTPGPSNRFEGLPEPDKDDQLQVNYKSVGH